MTGLRPFFWLGMEPEVREGIETIFKNSMVKRRRGG